MKMARVQVLVLPIFVTLIGGLSYRVVNGQQSTPPPNDKDAFRFGVIGDTGTGGADQYKIGAKLAEMQVNFPFNVVVMMGDNMYGGESPRDFQKKFELPYAGLLKNGVKFYASLGNHDSPNQRFYKNFNMDGKRYYSFKPNDHVRFFALDSNYMTKEELAWVEKELAASNEEWKIPYFHHPLYSSGDTHGSAVELRSVLEPLFLKNGVTVVLSGHEHLYERVKPQRGITYFTVGSSAKLRKGDIQKTNLTAAGFDTDNVFMICEINKDVLTFQVVSKTGKVVDSGTVQRSAASKAAAGGN